MSSQFFALLNIWRERLTESGRPAEIVWRFREHLTIRPGRRGEGGSFELSYQMGLQEVTESDVFTVMKYLLRTKQAVALQLLAVTKEHSVCTVAFDPWDCEKEILRGTDRVYYAVNDPYKTAEAVTSRWRWMQHRLSQCQVPSGLDFIVRLKRARKWIEHHERGLAAAEQGA